MMDKTATYPSNEEGTLVEDTVLGFNIIVHYPKNMEALKKRVAQAHADAVIAKVKNLNCSGEQKKALIDAIIE